MDKNDRKKLASLYPRAKSPTELHAERVLRELKRRPQFVELKISSWCTLCILVVVASYWIVSHIIASSLESAGSVIIGVSISLFLIMVAGAIIFYLYSVITSLATKSIVAHERLLVELVCIVAISLGVIALFRTVIMFIIISLLTFTVAYVVTKSKKDNV